MKSTWKKALWIAKQLDENVDDVYDVLLGNITAPYELYSSVMSLNREYDGMVDKVMNKEGLGG